MTRDREGVLVTGLSQGVDGVLEVLGEIGTDTMRWNARASRGAVREEPVIETTASGAIIGCEAMEVFLPFERSDTYIAEGDTVTVQVQDPRPPWSDHRPVAGTKRVIFGGLAHLERADGKSRADISNEEDANALIRETEVLPTEIPSGWRIRWQPSAIGASIDEKTSAVSELREKVSKYDQAVPVSPESSSWLWFGRQSREALDGLREPYVATIPGHHRIKASTDTAGTAVDFIEGLEMIPSQFPIETVFDVFGPQVGDSYQIDHGKPEGNRFTLGVGTVIDIDGDTVTVRREMTAGGEYDGLAVPQE